MIRVAVLDSLARAAWTAAGFFAVAASRFDAARDDAEGRQRGASNNPA